MGLNMTLLLCIRNVSCLRKYDTRVWPPGSADTLCPRPPLMTQVQHFVSRIKKWQRWNAQTCELMTLTFDLGSHGACGWCRSSSSTGTTGLKFVGLVIRKIWRMMCVSINGPGDPDLWPFDLETGMRVASKMRNLPPKFGHARPLGSRIIRNAYFPPSLRGQGA